MVVEKVEELGYTEMPSTVYLIHVNVWCICVLGDRIHRNAFLLSFWLFLSSQTFFSNETFEDQTDG